MMRLRELQISYRPLAGECLEQREITAASVAAAILRPILESEPVEVFGALLLDTRHRALAWHVLSRGTLDASLVHPRELIKAACLANAAAVIVAHNHPSGDPTPSSEDVTVTSRLAAATQLVGISLVDSLIIGDTGRWSSLRESGRIEPLPAWGAIKRCA